MKKIWLIIIAAVLLVLVMVIASADRPALQDQMQNVLNCVESALGDEWKKHTVTEVSDLVYSDDEGNTITYYICVTTYYESNRGNQIGLNTNAIAAVVDPNKAETFRECKVNGLPAAIYQKDGRAYLCWTIMPELSCVIEYDPAIQREEDIFRMAESIPAGSGG